MTLTHDLQQQRHLEALAYSALLAECLHFSQSKCLPVRC